MSAVSVSALSELAQAYADRAGTAARWRAADRPVVGYVGADVPVELLTAAGAVPLRLFGDPAGDRMVGDRYLGAGLDPVVRSVLSRLIAGDYPLDALVVSHDCEASLRLFYAVRELRRIEPGLGLPETYLIDILHLPHRTTTAYNAVRIGQFRDRLGDWFGRAVDDDALAAAVACHDEQRGLLSQLGQRRRASPATLTGTEHLAIVGAGTAMPVEAHVGLLRSALAEAGTVAGQGRRAFLTGSGHDTADVYCAIEAAGVTVVGEDHDWGELGLEQQVGEATNEALAQRYQYNGPSAARSTVRARAAHTAQRAHACGAELLICYARRNDDAPPWDFARQAQACGLPTVVLPRQSYGQVELEGLR